jgi:DNA-binding MarR family transcriptional regulator
MALRYFARANRFSRTVSGFAEYHATTRGTVSQTIKTLTERGYLSRIRSESDRRSVRLDLTEQGAAVMEADPLAQLIGFVEELPTAGQSGLHDHLRQLVADLAKGLQRPRFGLCCACRFLQAAGDDDAAASTVQCRFVGADLEPEDLARICVNFNAA